MNNAFKDFLRSMDELDAATEGLTTVDGEQGEDATEQYTGDVALTEEDEALIVLEAILEESTPKEFSQIMEAAQEMAIYGLIPDAAVESVQQFAKDIADGKEPIAIESIIVDGDTVEAATEAQKKITVKDWKGASMNRVTKRTCIRLAARDGYPAYAKYIKHRKEMIKAREDIYSHYENKAKQIAKKTLQNAGRKASNMGGTSGAALTKKINSQIKKNQG